MFGRTRSGFLLLGVLSLFFGGVFASLFSSSDKEKPPPPRIAICFFGLTRSLRHTAASIQGFLLEPLREAGIRFDIYMHTLHAERIHNPRSQEMGIALSKCEFSELNPRSVLIESQDDVLKDLNLTAYISKGDPWYDGYISVKNVLLQLHSLNAVTNLVVGSGVKYDGIIMARPDCMYFNHLNARQLIDDIRNPDHIFMPGFFQGFYFGANDRFAYGPTKAMVEYGTRRRHALEYAQEKPFHSETFLKDVLDKKKIKIKTIPLYFGRVRANGKLWEYPEKTPTVGIDIVKCDGKIPPCPSDLQGLANRWRMNRKLEGLPF